MPRASRSRALLDHRLWLLASLAASISYFFFRDNPLPGTVLIAWKGAGVGLLAVYAASRAKGADGKLLTATMALGALADMLLEVDLIAGGALFAFAHLVAIVLFLRNPRTCRTESQISGRAGIAAGNAASGRADRLPRSALAFRRGLCRTPGRDGGKRVGQPVPTLPRRHWRSAVRGERLADLRPRGPACVRRH